MTPLSAKMLQLADQIDQGMLTLPYTIAHRIKPEDAKRLRDQVAIFEEAHKNYTIDGNVRPYLGHWARTRKLWCEISGEPLV